MVSKILLFSFSVTVRKEKAQNEATKHKERPTSSENLSHILNTTEEL